MLPTFQPQIIRGARGLALTLFSWLLPLLAIIIGVFLFCLPFISLGPLWRTHFAGGLLLTAAALLVFLVNCAYQDGGEAWAASKVKRFAAGLGAAELTPLVGLAAWALALRVNQYGWSVQRIEAAAFVAVGAVYAFTYLAAIASAPRMKALEDGNIGAAYAILALVLAFFTPVADPARLMVANQLARLRSGVVAPDKFDFAALKFDGARWGEVALKRLSDDPEAPIRLGATRAQAMKYRYAFAAPAARAAALTVDERLARIDVFPKGRALPQNFLPALNDLALATEPCFIFPKATHCTAQFIALEAGKPEAILFSNGAAMALLFEQDENQQWRSANLSGQSWCTEIQKALKAGEVQTAPHPDPDLIVAGHRLVVTPNMQRCAPLQKR